VARQKPPAQPVTGFELAGLTVKVSSALERGGRRTRAEAIHCKSKKKCGITCHYAGTRMEATPEAHRQINDAAPKCLLPSGKRLTLSRLLCLSVRGQRRFKYLATPPLHTDRPARASTAPPSARALPKEKRTVISLAQLRTPAFSLIKRTPSKSIAYISTEGNLPCSSGTMYRHPARSAGKVIRAPSPASPSVYQTRIAGRGAQSSLVLDTQPKRWDR